MVGNFSLYRKGTMRARALPLARALVRRGHDVRIVLPALDTPRFSPRGEQDGVSIVHVAVAGSAGTALALAREAMAGSPEVVHTFKPISYAGLIASQVQLLRRLGLSRARLVVDTDDWEGTGGWATLANRPAWLRWLIDRQERWTLRHAAAVTVASRQLEMLVRGLRVPRERIHYVPNGADSSAAIWDEKIRRTRRQALALGDAPVILLYTRFFEYPLERVADVFARVAARVPGATLLVVGKGFHHEEDALRRLLVANGLSESARFVGWAEPETLPGYFAAADAAIYPLDDTLVNRTKCPAKLVELMAAGVPVVAEGVGQAREYVDDGASGLLIPTANVAAFAGALTNLLLDPELRLRLGTGAAERIQAHFLWDNLAAEVEKAYGVRAQDREQVSGAYAG
ncbi:MAG: glycosyltransferase family 4 protein [Chloroflexota bacterium]